MSEFLTVFNNLLYLDISYINTIFNGFWSPGLTFSIASYISISSGTLPKVSWISFYTLDSIDSSPAFTD